MAATTLADRAIIRLAGEDVRGFLDSLVTNEVAGTLPVWAGLLTPQGKSLFDFIIWTDGDDLLLDCEEDAVDDLVRRLMVYRLRRAIRIDRDKSISVHWAREGGHGVLDPRHSALGYRWLGTVGEAARGWHEHRLRLGVCEGRRELDDVLWLECNAAELNGVSFTKGCFIGQENTARMNWRQKVNRRLFVCEGSSGVGEKVNYPEIGLSVVHNRVDNVPAEAIIPDWLEAALRQPQR